MIRKEVFDWLEQAGADLKAAQDSLKAGNFFAAAFFGQQCAEKALKCYWLFRKKSLAPKVHDLLSLAEGLDFPKELMPKLRDLSPAYILSRYPAPAIGIPAKYYDADLSGRLLGYAEEVLLWVKSRIKN